MTVSFGPFVLDEDRRQLLEGAAELRLSPKAYDLLTTLVSLRPRAVSKTELQERLWPDTFVQEANLAVLVGEIRAALRDDPHDSRYVRTVHRFGYAFCADASESRTSPPDAQGARAPAAGDQARCWIVYDERETALGPGEHIIGRATEASVRVDLVSVSRRHARLVVGEAATTLEDLGSKNGTWVGPTPVGAPVVLEDGDEIRVGCARMTYRARTGPEATKTIAPG